MSGKIIIFDTETCGLPNKLSTCTKYYTNSSLQPSTYFSNNDDRELIYDKNNEVIGEKYSYICHGEVIQFSALVCDKSTLRPLQYIDFYCQPDEPISDGASTVNGITNDSIKALSGGKHLEDYIFGEYKDLFNEKGNVYIAYNIDFDKRVINNSLELYNNPSVDFGISIPTFIEFNEANDNVTYNLCAMKLYKNYKGLYKYSKLKDAVEQLGFTQETIKSYVNKIVGKDNNNTQYHNALYDVVATWALLYKIRPYV